jgi:hypothetical protein
VAREVTPREFADALRKATEHIKPGGKAMADGMAEYLVDRIRNRTLTIVSHGSQEYHVARAGAPPARGSGNLARHTFARPAHSGLRSTAWVENDSEYGRILEFGCVITPKAGKAMHWVDSRGSWFHTVLRVPPHPYIEPTVREAKADQEVLEAGIEAFLPYDP